MGANIGTTITGQLIALDVGRHRPAVRLPGRGDDCLSQEGRSSTTIGQIIAGLGVLFIGMDMMSAAMVPLRESEAFIDLMTQLLQSAAGHPGRRHLHRHHPVFLRLGRYPAGPGRQRRHRPSAARFTSCSARTSAPASPRCWPPSAPAATPSAPPSSTCCFNIIGTIALHHCVCMVTPLLTSLVRMGRVTA